MPLTFYCAPMSTATITEGVIAELGLAVDRVPLVIGPDGTRSPAFRAINPHGRVPTIVHDGIAIWESAAITLYLGETFGVAAGLYPEPGPQRGAAMAWVVWCNVSLAEAAGRVSAAMPTDDAGAVERDSIDWVPDQARDPGALERALADVNGCLAILNAALADRSFLLGEYSLVDTHVQGYVGWLASMGTALDAFPALAGWLDRCASRPALAAMMDG